MVNRGRLRGGVSPGRDGCSPTVAERITTGRDSAPPVLAANPVRDQAPPFLRGQLPAFLYVARCTRGLRLENQYHGDRSTRQRCPNRPGRHAPGESPFTIVGGVTPWIL